MRKPALRLFSGAVLTLVAFVAACGGDAADAPIRIGLAGPFQQPNGASMKLAAEMAAAEINATGGIDGRMIELVVRDDEASAEKAVGVAAFLRDSTEVVAVIGHVNSPATLAAAAIYNSEEEGGLVAISPASSSPLVSEAGPWTFRVCPSDLLHGPAAAQWAQNQLGSRRAAVLYTNDAYGRGVSEAFAEAFTRGGGAVIASDPYLAAVVDSSGSIDPYLVRAMRRGADALMIAGQAGEGMQIVRAARRLGFAGPVLGADGMTGVKDAGPAAEGIFVSSAFLPDRPTPAAQAFVSAYSQRFGQLPDHRGAMTYDALKLLAHVIGQVGADRERVRDYLERVGRGEEAFEGVSGRIAFDENGDVPGKEVAIGVVRDARLVTAVR